MSIHRFERARGLRITAIALGVLALTLISAGAHPVRAAGGYGNRSGGYGSGSGNNSGSGSSSGSSTTSQTQSFHALKNVKKWMTIDAMHKKVTIKVVAAFNGANGGYNFDGYANGNANFVVPLGWKVLIKFSNNSTSLNHSFGIATNHGNNLTMAKINGKQIHIPDPTMGISQGTTVKLNFTATPAGKFFFNCEMPGHSAAGMWEHFTINKKGKMPQILVQS